MNRRRLVYPLVVLAVAGALLLAQWLLEGPAPSATPPTATPRPASPAGGSGAASASPAPAPPLPAPAMR